MLAWLSGFLFKVGVVGVTLVALNRNGVGMKPETLVVGLGQNLGRFVGGLRNARELLTARTNRPNAVKTGLQKVGVGYNRVKYVGCFCFICNLSKSVDPNIVTMLKDLWAATRFRPQTLVPPSAPAPPGPRASGINRPPEALAAAIANEANLNAAVTGSAPLPPLTTQSAGDIMADYYRERRMLP